MSLLTQLFDIPPLCVENNKIFTQMLTTTTTTTTTITPPPQQQQQQQHHLHNNNNNNNTISTTITITPPPQHLHMTSHIPDIPNIPSGIKTCAEALILLYFYPRAAKNCSSIFSNYFYGFVWTNNQQRHSGKAITEQSPEKFI